MQQRKGMPATRENALAELYQCYVSTLLNYIRRYVPVREDAEDILVEVFLAAHERGNLVELREDERLAWLRRVAYYKCIDLLRRRQRFPTVALDTQMDVLYEADELSPERVALYAEEHSLLRKYLAELTVPQQIILHLKFGQRLSGAEIARRLNKSEGSVSKMLARALNQLRERYKTRERRSER
jgi:RNA polymerase sigma factor (sigma-70 family)